MDFGFRGGAGGDEVGGHGEAQIRGGVGIERRERGGERGWFAASREEAKADGGRGGFGEAEVLDLHGEFARAVLDGTGLDGSMRAQERVFRGLAGERGVAENEAALAVVRE